MAEQKPPYSISGQNNNLRNRFRTYPPTTPSPHIQPRIEYGGFVLAKIDYGGYCSGPKSNTEVLFWPSRYRATHKPTHYGGKVITGVITPYDKYHNLFVWGVDWGQCSVRGGNPQAFFTSLNRTHNDFRHRGGPN